MKKAAARLCFMICLAALAGFTGSGYAYFDMQ
jgi:hypothetical protein